jgi:hypothetical protein
MSNTPCLELYIIKPYKALFIKHICGKCTYIFFKKDNVKGVKLVQTRCQKLSTLNNQPFVISIMAMGDIWSIVVKGGFLKGGSWEVVRPNLRWKMFASFPM